MAKKVKCPECDGYGFTEDEIEDDEKPGEFYTEEADCDHCDGSGYVEADEED